MKTKTAPRGAAVRPSREPAAPRRSPAIDHIVLITLDSVGEGDRAAMEALPAYARLMREGSFSFRVKSVWPSLTYVAHATMQTGRSPSVHGIGHNCVFRPRRPAFRKTWYWYRRQIRVPTFFDLARSSGWSTATVSYPVTGKARITWNFPEIGGISGASQMARLAGAGSLPYLLDINARYGWMLRGSREPDLDEFLAACADHAIRTKRPGLIAIHLLDADKAKHLYGVSSEEAKASMAHLGRSVEKIRAAVEAAGIAGSTAFVLAGDHSQFDVKRRLRLNVLLREAGLIRESWGGVSWQAWVEEAGGSAILRTRGPEAERKALALLREAAARPDYGIARILDRVDLRRLGADDTVAWALDGKPGTEFEDGIEGPVLTEVTEAAGAHGYRPDLPGYGTVFFASGPGISRGRDLGGMDLLDVAPILGSIMGFTMPQAEGRIPEGFFEEA